MIVTINTDASYKCDYEFAGFALWISSNQGRIKRYGILKQVKDCNDAEIQCIGNALSIVKSNLDLSQITKIIINTDSKNAEKHILNHYKTYSAVKIINKIIIQIKKKF